MTPIAARYHEVLRYRVEGIRRYGGLFTSDLYGVPKRLSLPSLSLTAPSMPSVRIGPFHFGDRPPILGVLMKTIAETDGPLTIVELGPGAGTMALSIREAFGSGKIARYCGIERDPSVRGPYERIDFETLPPRIDAFIASEVIEHMPFEDFFGTFLPEIVSRMDPRGAAVLGTPNALSPAAIFGDFTHVQGYACFDLYGLMRLFFEDVSLYRTRYLWSPERLVTLIPRILLCRALELDWCEGLVCVGRSPRIEGAESPP